MSCLKLSTPLKLGDALRKTGKEIASLIGESIFYNDIELYSLCSRLAKEQYNTPNPSLVPKDGKIALANTLHYDYNASNKQIVRLLKLEINTVNSLFPECRR